MTLDRRQFLSATPAIAATGLFGTEISAAPQPAGTRAVTVPPSPGELCLYLTGLSLFDLGNLKATIYFLRPRNLLGISDHAVVLTAAINDLEQAPVEPDDYIQLPNGEQAGKWQLDDVNVALAGVTSTGGLKYGTTAGGKCPTNDDWSSMYWLPDVATAGSSSTVESGHRSVAVTLVLAQGTLKGVTPSKRQMKERTWRFEKGTGETGQAYTDRVEYRVAAAAGQTLALQLTDASGRDKGRFAFRDPRSVGIVALLSSEPKRPVYSENGAPRHFDHLYDVLKGAKKNSLLYQGRCTGEEAREVGTAYCPPGRKGP